MYTDKDPTACHALTQDGWTYLDVRTPEEFSGGHPEGSVNIPFALIGPGGMMPNPQFLSIVGALYPTDTKFVVGCASGGRSARACQMLAQMGFDELVNVQGGFSGARNAQGEVEAVGWADSGLPTAGGDDDGSYTNAQARARRS